MSMSKLEYEKYLTAQLTAEPAEGVTETVFDFFDALLIRAAAKVSTLDKNEYMGIDPDKRYESGSFNDIIASITALLSVIYYSGMRHGKYVDKDVTAERMELFHRNYLFCSDFMAECKANRQANSQKRVTELIKDVETILDKDKMVKDKRSSAKSMPIDIF